MTSITTTFLFFVYIFGFGYSVSRFLPTGRGESTILRLGLGLAVFPIIGNLLNVLYIPIDWRIFLLLALAIPLYDLTPHIRNFQLSSLRPPTIDRPAMVLLVIFSLSLIIYCYGPFSYPWLEDDDSWHHAASIKFITVEKHLRIDQGVFQYLNPYPPGYDIIMAVLHQTSPSLYWTLKFFNSLIISMSLLFFYCMVKEFSGNRGKAVWAAFFLSVIPGYLSHFIWSHGLIISIFFIAFYTLIKAEKDQRFLLPAIMAVAGIFLIQPTKSLKFLILLFLLWSASALIKKRPQISYIKALIGAGLISLLWWLPVIYKYFQGVFLITLPQYSINFAQHMEAPTKLLTSLISSHSGTATRAYTVEDYLEGPRMNMINNPIGIGTMICVLAGLGILIFLVMLVRQRRDQTEDGQRNKVYALTVLFWLIFTFLGMNTATFNIPIGLFAFRFWALFSIPVAMLAAETMTYLWTRFKIRPLKLTAVISIILCVLATSGLKKLKVNTAIWPWGIEFISFNEVAGYTWLRTKLPADSKVFAFTKNFLVIGNDMFVDYWREDYKKAFKDSVQMEIPILHTALKQQRFEYLILGQKEVQEFGLDAMNLKVKALEDSGLFQVIYANPSVRIYKILKPT